MQGVRLQGSRRTFASQCYRRRAIFRVELHCLLNLFVFLQQPPFKKTSQRRSTRAGTLTCFLISKAARILSLLPAGLLDSDK